MSELIHCLIVDDDPLSRKILESLISKTDFLVLVKSVDNALEASNLLRKEKIDLLFLDVEMPEMTGLELIQSLHDQRPEVVLVSAQEKYALDAFEYDVTDYLVKPVNQVRFLKAVNKVQENLKPVAPLKLENNHLFVKVDQRLLSLNLAEILYIEALADYVTIHTEQGKYTVYSTMKGIESRLPETDFLRVHRSFIVNKKKIQSIEDNLLTIGAKVIPVGVTYREKLMNSLNLL
jgi:DNA-binding LytR/AlgR family response regulator